MINLMIKFVVSISLLAIISIILYQKYVVYIVPPSDEAIIVRFGNIIGSKKNPGLHRKLPFVDKVISINTVKIRKWERASLKLNCNIIIFWKVIDSLSYYRLIANEFNDNIELNKIFSIIVERLELKFDASIKLNTKNIIVNSNETILKVDPSLIKDVTVSETSNFGIKIVKILLSEFSEDQ